MNKMVALTPAYRQWLADVHSGSFATANRPCPQPWARCSIG
jgi:hypothetical protein